MSLDNIRDEARARVHAEFALPAVARSLDGLSSIPIAARLHRDMRKPFGDVTDEGFALMIESYNQVIVDTTEWTPQRNWLIDFGRGRVVTVDNMEWPRGERYATLNVSEKRP